MTTEKDVLLARIRASAEAHKRVNDEWGYDMPKGAVIYGLTYPEAMVLLDDPPAAPRPWCLCDPGVGPHDADCPTQALPPAEETR